MATVIRMNLITRPFVRFNPQMRFVFGDNLTRKGIGGQAGQMRGEPNTIGVVTKRLPSMQPNAFLTDDDANGPVLDIITRDLQRVTEALEQGHDVVIPADGIGTGLAGLPQRAPKLYAFISGWIAALERQYGA